ncbi:tail protein X [Sphingomonas oryzagri]|uniref:Tail protein X n=1 Tax=Sphingomonas oryzagri TaxID=3042314 RepID=A0ABT6N7W1_9SPHN|nr:tail protein X [Sphingomonas oryzagri]MDH7641188.1 tail protein X [Sphingomonas oryzagri]
MADTVTARQGDTVELLLWRERAIGPSGLDAVFAANPGLAALGTILPIGTVVTVPATVTAASTTPTLNLVQLWDD